MAIDQVYLADINVKESLIKRLLAVYRGNIPEPPSQLKDLGSIGRYAGVNEYYAIKLLIAQRKRPTVRGVLELIGGTTKTVNDNINLLKSKLPPSEFEVPEDSEEAELVKFKKKLIEKEKALFEVELEEQESFYIEQAARQEESHKDKLTKLQSELDKAYGHNGAITSILEESQKTNEQLRTKLKNNSISMVELDHFKELEKDLRQQIHQLKEAASLTHAAYEKERAASARTIQDLRDERDQADNRAQLALNDSRDTKRAMTRYLDERDKLLSENFILREDINQIKLGIEKEHEVDAVVLSIKTELSPLAELKMLLKDIKNTSKEDAIDTRSIITSINDLSANVLNLARQNK